MKLRIKLGRRHVEAVTEHQTYPEPWLLGGFWYRALLGRPMDNVRWTNSTFFRSASTGEASAWLRLAGWHRALIRVVSTYLLMLTLPLTLMLVIGGALTNTALMLIYWHIVFVSGPLLILDHYFRKEHGVRIPWRVREQEHAELSDEQLERLSAVEQEELLSAERMVWRMLTVRPGRKEWEREVVEPLAAVVSSVLGDASPHRPGEARHWIDVPRDYMLPKGAPVEIQLPRSYSGAVEATNRKLVSAARSSLGMLEADAQWLLKGRNKRLLLSAPAAPPEIALFRDYEQQLLSMTEPYRPVLGVVASGELLAAEMIDDSPHIALSAGSGAGKSMLMRALIMQVLHWGWAVIILDYKVESHEWARGLPGVTYVTTIQGIHDMGVRLGEEVEIRKNLPKDERAMRPRTLIVREEWNMTAAKLMDYWQGLRAINMSLPMEEREVMGLKSPALRGFGDVTFAGRSFGLFDLLAAQRMSNRVFNGNTDLRENYMIRLLARYTVQTWKMLLSHIKYMRKPSQLGGWVVAAGDEATYIQGLLISEEEARAFSLAGAPNPMSAFSSGNGLPVGQHDPVGATEYRTLEDQLPEPATGGSRVALGSGQPDATTVRLRKLADLVDNLKYLAVTDRTLREWRDSDPSFPEIKGGAPRSGWLYSEYEVHEFAKRKRASQAAERNRR